MCGIERQSNDACSHPSPLRPAGEGTKRSRRAIKVRRTQATFRDFVRLAFAVRRQPELSSGFGIVYWGLRTLALPLLYASALRRGRPYYVLIEDEGRIVGAFSAWGGWIGNAVVQTAPALKRPVMRLLYDEARAYLDRPEMRSQRLRARTIASNRSIILGLRTFGFEPEADEYMITLPLGPLTCSWRSAHASSNPRLRSLQLTRLVREPK